MPHAPRGAGQVGEGRAPRRFPDEQRGSGDGPDLGHGSGEIAHPRDRGLSRDLVRTLQDPRPGFTFRIKI